MANRELVVLGTASQVPTKKRNHNGYLLRWDGLGILFDPGEGTQRQLALAGQAVNGIRHICLTHFHGDHCLGLPGVLQRLSLDQVAHPVAVHYPASGQEYFDRLRTATPYHQAADVRAAPVTGDGVLAEGPFGVLEARALAHRIDCYGYRLAEPDGRSLRPDLLARYGLHGPAVGELQRAGRLDVDGRTVTLDEVSVHRRGQRFAFVMDTARCAGALDLAADADLLVIESTFTAADAELAAAYGHLTARDAGQIAAEAGAHTLVLTHFSRRYPDPRRFLDDAAAVFTGDIVLAEDLLRIPLPPRH